MITFFLFLSLSIILLYVIIVKPLITIIKEVAKITDIYREDGYLIIITEAGQTYTVRPDGAIIVAPTSREREKTESDRGQYM